MSSLFDTPIRMAREMRQRYFSDDCSPMSAFTGIFRDYHIELQYESHGDSLRREGETYIITLPRNTSPERDVYPKLSKSYPRKRMTSRFLLKNQ